MATKLKNLKIKKVDFVDEGANPAAHVMLYKNKGWDTEGSENKEMDISGTDIEAHNQEGLFKRVIAAIGKALNIEPDTVEKFEKGNAGTFGEKLKERSMRRVGDEIWDLCYALQESLCSIIYDDEAENKQELMEESVEQFGTVILQAVTSWASGDTSGAIKKSSSPASEEELWLMQYSKARIEDMIAKAVNGTDLNKGDEEGETMIDKSLMTSAERLFYEDLEKRYSIPDDNNSGTVTKAGEKKKDEENNDEDETDGKGKPAVKKSVQDETSETENEDIYKGLHPLVAAELKLLRKRADEAEEKELAEVAKKYEILGKKPEELIPTLKALKAAGGTAYNDMIGVLDSTLATVNTAGVFGEIGKSREGSPGTTRDEAVAKARAKAAEIRKSRPELTEAQALDEAFLEDPELRAMFDE